MLCQLCHYMYIDRKLCSSDIYLFDLPPCEMCIRGNSTDTKALLLDNDYVPIHGSIPDYDGGFICDGCIFLLNDIGCVYLGCVERLYDKNKAEIDEYRKRIYNARHPQLVDELKSIEILEGITPLKSIVADYAV